MRETVKSGRLKKPCRRLIPRSGFTTKPGGAERLQPRSATPGCVPHTHANPERVAQPAGHRGTLSGFASLVGPVFSGCAPRPRAMLFNAFGVIQLRPAGRRQRPRHGAGKNWLFVVARLPVSFGPRNGEKREKRGEKREKRGQVQFRQGRPGEKRGQARNGRETGRRETGTGPVSTRQTANNWTCPRFLPVSCPLRCAPFLAFLGRFLDGRCPNHSGTGVSPV